MDDKDPNAKQPVSFDNGIDMDAINAAVDAAKSEPDDLPHAIDVDKISLSDTPTNSEELKKQQEEHPEIDRSGSEATTSQPTDEAATTSEPAPVEATDEVVNLEEAEVKTEGSSLDSDSGEANQESGDASGDEGKAEFSETEGAASAITEDDSFTIDKESGGGKAQKAVDDANKKAQDIGRKALNILLPKNTLGVIVVAIICTLIILGIIIAIAVNL